MELFVVLIFIFGYIAITMEHKLKIDKLIPALLMMVLAWTGIALGLDDFSTFFDAHTDNLFSGFRGLLHEEKLTMLEGTLLHHFGKTAEILVFLIGAMTIVEIIDHFNGFSTIKSFVKTNKKRTLLWIVCVLGFILSSIIDNLTATIVLITILRKLLPENKDRIWYAGLIIISANAGGAWSPIGDVTTTMLWMGNKVTAVKLMEYLVIPSLFCLIVPLFIASFLPAFKGNFTATIDETTENKHSKLMFYLGLSLIVFVPIFKTITHLPPYVGMMLSLAIIALVAEILSNKKFNMSNYSEKEQEVIVANPHQKGPTLNALTKIEFPSILFFLGILMTVAAMESLGLIFDFGNTVRSLMPNEVFIILLGVSSAVIDNVPLVAASMGMYDATTFPTDAHIWHFIAFSAGTGGSMLIIGSAAGVVAMGMEKINFFWYLKNIAWLALLGFLAGCISFIFIELM
ncbi:MAG: sodium:proton antiporter [Flavobacteriales bacterium CG_4_10_14_0_2_um_filter_32_8]|nr:MAG: sodium:proton antiporter [Flavobacteriales bacterium CG_4_10_14_0_2_um_filter_32_8]